MRKLFAILVVFLFVSNVFVFSPAHADTEGVEVIGRYEDVLFGGDLTEKHLVEQDDGFILKAPKFAQNLAVDLDYLDATLPGWAADERFSIEGARAAFPAKDITFLPFEPSETAVFTMGSDDSIRFSERPMWVWIEEVAGKIRVHMDDGQTAGQAVFIAEDWLWRNGIHRPKAIHEDGSLLNVTKARERDGFLIDVHHFSFVELTADDIIVLGRQDDSVFPHLGTRRWYPEDERLEIDVLLKTAPYNLMVEKSWFDVNLPYHQVKQYRFSHEIFDDDSFYVFSLVPDQTPTTVVWEPYAPSESPVWTFGDPTTIFTHAFNETLRLNAGAAMLSTSIDASGFDVTIGNSDFSGSIAINKTYLGDLQIKSPNVTRQEDGSYVFSYFNFEDTHLIIESPEDFRVVEGATMIAHEGRVFTGRAVFNHTTEQFDVLSPIYTGYLQYGFNIALQGLPWDSNLAEVALDLDGSVVQTRNRTHYGDGSYAGTEDVFFTVEEGSEAMNLTIRFNDPDGEQLVEHDPLFWTDDPVEAGLVQVDSSCSGFKIVKDWRDTDGYGNPKESVSTDEHDIAGYASVLHIRYKNDCYNEDWKQYWLPYAFSARAKSRIVGNGHWTMYHGGEIKGDSNPKAGGTGHVTVMYKLRAGLFEPTVDGAAIVRHATVGQDAKEPVWDCEPEKIVHYRMALEFAVSFLPGYAKAGIPDIPDEQCWATLRKWTGSFNGGYTGYGGEVVAGTSKDPRGFGFLSTWHLEMESGTQAWLQTRAVAKISIEEEYGSFCGMSSGCTMKYSRVGTWQAYTVPVHLEFVRSQ